MAYRQKSESPKETTDQPAFNKLAAQAAANADRSAVKGAKPAAGKLSMPEGKGAKKGKSKTTVATINLDKKKSADAALIDMANEQDGGKSKPFLEDVRSLETLMEQRKNIGDKIKAKRIYLKETYKTELRALDIVVRDRRMKPEDVAMRDLNVSNYKKQLGMELSSYQQTLVEENKTKLDQTRRAMSELHGEDAGEEVGSRKNALKPEEKLEEEAAEKPITGPVESEAAGVVH